MRNVKYLACGAALLASCIGVSSASAANWDPQGTALTATSTNSVLTPATGAPVACPVADLSVTATGDLARTSAALVNHNPVFFGGGCLAGGALPTDVTTFGTWEFTATSTTNVNASATGTGAGGTGPVAVITITGSSCVITIDGPVSIPNNVWHNASHQLTINNTATFPFTTTAGCNGLVTSPARLSGTFQLPTTAIIT